MNHANKEAAMADVKYFEVAALEKEKQAAAYRAMADRLRKQWGEPVPARE